MLKKIFSDKRILFLYFITILLLIMGTTYALQSTFSGIFASTAIVRIDEESYGSSTFDTTSLKPILDKDVESSKDNIIHIDFTVGGDRNNNRDNIIYDIALTDLNVNCDLLSPYIKWKLVKNGKELSTGSLDYHFDTIVNGRLVLTTIQEDLPTYNENQQGYDKYNFYMWISDSCQSDNLIDCLNNPIDQSELLNKNLSGKIEVELYTDSKKELVRKPANELDTSICENKYLVEYDLNGGTSTTKSKYVTNGSSYGDLPTPTREDITVTYDTGYEENINSNSISYTFDGWYLSNQYKTNELVTKDTTVTKLYNHKLYAKWNKSSNNITLPSITREGYTFEGWYSDSEFTNKVGAGGDSYTPTNNITLYAKWIVKAVTVKFMRNYDETDTEFVTKTYTYGVSGQQFDSGFTKKGYDGYGWTDSPGATRLYLFNNEVGDDFIENHAGETVTYYAIWNPKTYTVTYRSNLIPNNNFSNGMSGWRTNANGDAVIDSSIKYNGINSLRISSNTADWAGIVSTDTISYKPDTKYRISVKVYRDSSSTYGDLTRGFRVYARANNSDGSVLDYHHYIYIDTSNLPDKTWKEFSYEFTTNSPSGAYFAGMYLDFNAVDGVSNIWIAEPMLEEVQTRTVTYGTTLEAPPTVVRDNHTLAGWTTNSNGTDDGYNWSGWSGTWTYDNGQYGISNNNLILNARWNVNNYTLTVNPNGGSYNGSTGSTTYTQEYDSTRSLPNPIPSSYTVTFDANGGSVSTSSATVTKTFSGWTKSGIGEYVTGSSPPISGTIVSRTQKSDSSGVYDNFSYSVNNLSSNTWYYFQYPTYQYNPGSTYDIRFKLKINSLSSTGLDFRHSAISNNYEVGNNLSYWRVFYGPTDLTPIIFTRTFIGTTFDRGGTTYNIEPLFEIFTSNLKDRTDNVNFDLRDMNIIDRTSLQLIQANANTFWFRKGNGTLTANYTNGSFSLPTPTRSGYTFNGWYTAESGGTQITDTNKNQITSTTILYAQWTVKTVNVKFMRNYNSSDTTSVTRTYTYGASNQAFNSGFTRTGYTGSGWSTSSGGSQVYTFTNGVSNAWIDANAGTTVTLYGVWTANTYTITLNNNSATSVGTSTVYEKYGTGIYLNSNGTNLMTTSSNRITVPTKSGYIFEGYYTTFATLGTSYTSSSSSKILTINNFPASANGYQGCTSYNFSQQTGIYTLISCTNFSLPTANYYYCGSTNGAGSCNMIYHIDSLSGWNAIGTTQYSSVPLNPYPSATGTQLINASGYITSSFSNTLYGSNTTLYAKWTKS